LPYVYHDVVEQTTRKSFQRFEPRELLSIFNQVSQTAFTVDIDVNVAELALAWQTALNVASPCFGVDNSTGSR
jgi:hypothetical protein